jgi:hypothetical protein
MALRKRFHSPSDRSTCAELAEESGLTDKIGSKFNKHLDARVAELQIPLSRGRHRCSAPAKQATHVPAH